MRTYDKRIGFLVSSQTLIPHGGIGQFTKSFCELMNQHNIKVDIIVDKPVTEDNFIKSLNARIIAPKKVLAYTAHNNLYSHKDTFNYARMENFSNAISRALHENMYDVLVCNTYETVQVASTMGLEESVQIIAYTHLESQIFKDTKNPFLHNVNVMMRQQLQTDNVFIGTQSKFNASHIGAYNLPIPISERDLLTEYTGEREGILFVGRWEEGKNPELFIDLIEQIKLPAKVMTSPTGVSKFEERLANLGVKYDVRASIIGQEKVDFIKSSRIAFNPSIVESYGMAFYEQHIQLPTLVLTEQRWTNNFNSDFFYTCNKKNMAEKAKELYDVFEQAERWYNLGSLEHAQDQESKVFHKWNECFNEFKPKQSSSTTAKICQETTVKYKDFTESIGRTLIEDYLPIYTNKHRFRVIYTDNDTYLTKDPSFEPTEEETGISLFNF
jgi:glycosyltransferase involved in cell wall biosynthesis